MASLFHRSRQRRAERAPLTDAGNLNLVPLIDVLTSIVFFALLTYTGAIMAMLTAYDLTLPPTVITADDAKNSADERERATLLLAVKIWDDSLRVEHSEEGGFRQRIAGTDDRALDTLQALMTQIRRRYPQNEDVLVVPSDEVLYDDVIKVLERLRLANYRGISLGARARSTQVASAGR
jgi:biopolymer transport protein ExbD